MKKINVGKIADRFIPAFLRPYWDKRSDSPIGYRIAQGGFWSMMGTGVPQALNLISSIIIARLLGKVHLGEYGMILSTTGMFGIFTGVALAITSTKFVAEFRKNDPAKAGRTIAFLSLLALGIAVLMAGFLIIAAPWLAQRTLGAPHLANLLRISAGIIFFGAINGVQMGSIAGFEAFRTIAWINTLNGGMSFILLAGGAYFFGLPGVVLALVVAGAFMCIISSIELRSVAHSAGVQIDFTKCFNDLSILLNFSLPALLTGIISIPANWACAAMLVNMQNGYAELGIYGAANPWQKVIMFLPGCLNYIALPMLSDFHGAKQSRQYRKAFWYNMILIVISALAVAVIVALASSFIMRIYGPEFSSGRNVLIIISFTAVINAIDTFIGVNVLAKGRMWFGVASQSLWGALLLTIAYFLIPIYGAVGLCIAMLVAYLLQTIWQMLYISKVT